MSDDRTPRVSRRGALLAFAGVLVLVAVVVAAVSLGGGDQEDEASVTLAPAPAGVSVVVPTTQLWTDTGVDVAEGDQVTVVATGEATAAQGGVPHGPDGIPDNPDIHKFNMIPNTNHNALIATIAEEGDLILVGAHSTFTAPSTGRLYLGVNDYGTRGEGPENNSGSFTARIDVARGPGSTPEAPPATSATKSYESPRSGGHPPASTPRTTAGHTHTSTTMRPPEGNMPDLDGDGRPGYPDSS